jgi:membrane-bound serine protease (ClpP class)
MFHGYLIQLQRSYNKYIIERDKLKIFRFIILLGILLISLFAVGVSAAESRIDILEIDGVITPVMAEYIERSIDQSEDTGAQFIIIEMDTPGGLDTSMREIIQEIVTARVPVVVFVSPSGARAASAGAYISIAAQVAAMSPGTNIGAATPVSLEGGEIPEDMRNKIINDSVAYIRSLAEANGRNAEWAEKAVREGASATEREAFDLGVVDILADNLDDLLGQLDGWQVTLLGGMEVTLDTQDIVINRVSMSFVESFLYAIADPNIALVLMSLAVLGLTVEITTPGIGFPGIAGAICFVLAFYSLGVLQVNFAGVVLIILAFGLFIAEIFTPTFGLFTAGGIASLILGSLILFRGGAAMQVNVGLVVGLAIVIAGLFGFVIQRALRAHRRQASTGREGLVGKSALVKVALDPEGTVLYDGERWTAILDKGQADTGEEVIITKFDGMKLYVTKK